jgi:hypothetical protein
MADREVTGEQCLVGSLAVYLYAVSLPAGEAPRDTLTQNVAAQVLRAVTLRGRDRVEPRIRRRFGHEIADAQQLVRIDPWFGSGGARRAPEPAVSAVGRT